MLSDILHDAAQEIDRYQLEFPSYAEIEDEINKVKFAMRMLQRELDTCPGEPTVMTTEEVAYMLSIPIRTVGSGRGTGRLTKLDWGDRGLRFIKREVEALRDNNDKRIKEQD